MIDFESSKTPLKKVGQEVGQVWVKNIGSKNTQF